MAAISTTCRSPIYSFRLAPVVFAKAPILFTIKPATTNALTAQNPLQGQDVLQLFVPTEHSCLKTMNVLNVPREVIFLPVATPVINLSI